MDILVNWVLSSIFRTGCSACFLNEPSKSGKQDGFSNNLVTKMDGAIG